MNLTSIEICAGAGGQALGLEQAGFDHLALVEIEPLACQTLKANRPKWNVIESDVKNFSANKFKGVDLLAVAFLVHHFQSLANSLDTWTKEICFPKHCGSQENAIPK